jgi:hypothetical protein
MRTDQILKAAILLAGCFSSGRKDLTGNINHAWIKRGGYMLPAKVFEDKMARTDRVIAYAILLFVDGTKTAFHRQFVVIEGT